MPNCKVCGYVWKSPEQLAEHMSKSRFAHLIIRRFRQINKSKMKRTMRLAQNGSSIKAIQILNPSLRPIHQFKLAGKVYQL